MDKNIIKKYLAENFISEEAKHPALTVTEKVQKDSEKVNKDAMKVVEKEMSDYDKAATNGEKENSEAVKKYENDEEQQEVHDNLESLNGVEMLIPDNNPGDVWEERQKKAITGKDSELGNNRDYANVIPDDQKGFTGKEFGEKLYNNIEDSKKKRKDAEIAYAALGDDIELTKKGKKVNEGMKRIVFKKEFNGVENALKLIPESFKVDNKEFQMTDGNENYEIRWEGSLNEGKAVILKASDKTLMNEDMQHMKHLMGYKSQDTLGNLKGSERINENKSFNDIWDKTKGLLEENETMQEINNLNAFDYMNSDKEHQAHLNKLKDKKAEFNKSDERRVHPACFNSYNPDTGGGWKLPELIEFLKDRYNIEDSHIEQIKKAKNSMEVKQYLTQEFGECPK